jgi:hypothetical protein
VRTSWQFALGSWGGCSAAAAAALPLQSAGFAALNCADLSCALLRWTALIWAVLCRAALHCAVLCCAVQRRLRCTALCCGALCCRCGALCSAALHSCAVELGESPGFDKDDRVAAEVLVVAYQLLDVHSGPLAAFSSV